MAKALMILGILIFLIGVLAHFGILTQLWKILPIGKLPGDIEYKGENTRFYFPVMSSIVISVVLTLLFRLFNR